MPTTKSVAIPKERIISQIYVIRGKKVMLDRDLAELYGVTTGNFNKAVTRNLERFPEDWVKLYKGTQSCIRLYPLCVL